MVKSNIDLTPIGVIYINRKKEQNLVLSQKMDCRTVIEDVTYTRWHHQKKRLRQ